MYCTIKVAQAWSDAVEDFINEQFSYVEYVKWGPVSSALWAEVGERSLSEAEDEIREGLNMHAAYLVVDEEASLPEV